MNNKVKIGRITQQALEDASQSRRILAYEGIREIDLTRHPWTPFEADKKYLTGKNFRSAQCLAYDFDNVPGKTYLALKDALSKFESYDCIIGTTRSHQTIKPPNTVPVDKFRVILILENPITDGEQYKQNYVFYADLLNITGSIDECGDLARFFYPFKEIVFTNIKGTILPVQDKLEVVKKTVKPPSEKYRGNLSRTILEFQKGFTAKGSRHDAAKDAITELRKLNYSAVEILDILEGGWAIMKPEALENELSNMIDWVMENVEPAPPEATIKKSLNKSTTYLLTKKKNRGFGIDEYQKAILDMLKCGYNNSEILEILKPIFVETNPEQDISELSNLLENLSSSMTTRDSFQSLLLEMETHFADKMCLYRDRDGTEKLFEYTKPNTIRQTGHRNFLVQFTDKLAALGHENMLAKEIKDLFETYLLKTKNKLSTLPPAFSLNHDELAFNHITLDIVEGPTPTWDDFISRCGPNAQAMMAFIWSIFEKDAKLPQYLMMMGSGQDGKGSFTEWLGDLLGDLSFASLNADDPHWTAQCIGKRVGFFQELNNPKIVMSSQFKAITGGDAVTVTQKYDKAFTAVLDVRFILVTNQLPEFTSKAAEKRRIILVKVAAPTINIPNYKIKIREEASGFLFKCREAFNKLYNKEMLRIECEYDGFELLSSSFEEQYTWLFDKCFVPYEHRHKNEGVSSSDFVDIVKLHLKNPDRNFMNNFKDWMYRTKGVAYTKSGNTHYYTGIALKDKTILKLVGGI